MYHFKNGGLPCNHHKIKEIENSVEGGSYALFHLLFIAFTHPLSSITLFIFAVGGMCA